MRLHRAVIISTNQILDIWYEARNADPRRKHNYRPVLSEVISDAIRPINEREEFSIRMSVELRSKTRPRLHQERYCQAFPVPLPPANRERVAAKPGENAKFGD